MKDFLVIDDDCLELFDDIMDRHKERAFDIIGPMDVMKKMLFWILGEDGEADPGVVIVDTDWDEDDDPYLLYYIPNVEFSIWPFELSMHEFNDLVYIYDKLSSSYLECFNEDKVIPYHYEREDEEEQAVTKEVKARNQEKNESVLSKSKGDTGIHSIEASEVNDLPGFMETYTTPDGDYVSYSFYSTDKELVEAIAKHRSEVRRIMDDSIKE